MFRAQGLKKHGIIDLAKAPTLRFLSNFSERQLSAPARKMAKQNQYMRHSLDVVYLHTKFHLGDISGSEDAETACMFHKSMLTL